MALFSITRYTGESEIDEENASKRSLLLSRLNERALKRKQEFTSNTEGNEDVKRQKRTDGSGAAERLKKRKFTKDSLTSIENSEIRSKSTKKAPTSRDNAGSEELNGEQMTKHKKVKKLETHTGSSLCREEEGEKQGTVTETTKNEDLCNSEEPKPFTVIGKVLKKRKQKVERVLPQWLAHPSVVKADIRNNTTPLCEISGIDDHLIHKLNDYGIQSYFPVQAQVIPALLADAKTGFLTGRAGYRPCDICCSAPTGSGKTLAYVLPLVQALQARVTCQVRALVVLPVRELAVQVFKVFQTFCAGTPLKVGAMVGYRSFQQEQQSLLKRSAISGQYLSQVDIVVATPGRLVDHINRREGFTLSHLRYLVIDEADRMMEEIKQDWLAEVERHVFISTPHGVHQRIAPGPLTAANIAKAQTPLQKLLFSATLSQNPEKLEQLGLFQPRLFTSVVDDRDFTSVQIEKDSRGDGSSQSIHKGIQEDVTDKAADTRLSKSHEESSSNTTSTHVKGEFIGKYTTPSGLTEFYCPCSSAQKALVMLYFLHQLKFRNVLCFTNSVEVTHRLFWLIKLVGGVEVKEFSSKHHAQKRAKLLTQFKAGKIHVLVCSDAMARGMDISNVKYVISYESPPFLKTYIHRVGRTARAGKVGTAITLLQKKEIYHFKKMLKEAGKTGVKEMCLSKADLKPFVEPLSESLKQLPDILKSEKMKK